MRIQRIVAFVLRVRSYVVLTALLVASVALMQIDGAVPLHGLRALTVVGIGAIQGVFGGIPNPWALRRENELLHQLNVELLSEVARLRRAQAENEQLRQLLGLRPQIPYEFITAEVVGLTVGQLRNYATLNRGAADGLQVGMPVVTAAGLVGRIREVSAHYAIVELLENRDVRIAVRLEGSGAEGIVVWEGNVGQFALQYIPSSIPVQAGELVVTSSSSDRFPPGIPVGTVYQVHREAGSGFYRILVVPRELYQRLRYVAVLRHIPHPERRLLEQRYFWLGR